MLGKCVYSSIKENINVSRNIINSLVILIAFTFSGILSTVDASTNQIKRQSIPAVNLAQFPIYFEANQGQVTEEVKYIARGQGHTLWLTDKQILLSLTPQKKDQISSTLIRMRLLGDNHNAKWEGRAPLEGKVHYLKGRDSDAWLTHVPTYGEIVRKQIYGGIDLVYHGSPQKLEYDFVVAPGSDPKQISIAFDGISKLHLDEFGNLLMQTKDGGQLRQNKPIIYQDIKNKREIVNGKYILNKNNNVSFQIAQYDKRYPLVIDPVLDYATYLGGDNDDTGTALAVDETGAAYVTGTTNSISFPSVNALQAPRLGDKDTFIIKLSPDGNSLIYATYLGGSGEEGYKESERDDDERDDDEYDSESTKIEVDTGRAIKVDSEGQVVIAGSTNSNVDFPLVNAIQNQYGGGSEDAYVAKLSADGGALLFSTYIGGSKQDSIYGLALNAENEIAITGITDSSDFPIKNAYQSQKSYYKDAFVTKLTSNGSSIVFSTYLGGSGNDQANAIAFDKSNNVYISGWTKSKSSFPITNNAAQSSFGGYADAFVVKLNTDGQSIGYATYLGGEKTDSATAIDIDLEGNAIVAGWTNSDDDDDDFPITSGVLQKNYAGGYADGFVAKLNATGETFRFVSYLGGGYQDRARSITHNAMNEIVLSGWTGSSNFPIKDAIQDSKAGYIDAFVTRIKSDGSEILESTYLGGEYNDQAYGLALDPVGNWYVTGITKSTNFPTVNAVQPSFGGGKYDSFVAKLGDNVAPEITSLPIIQATFGLPYNYQVQANDSNGDILTYEFIESPTGMNIDESSGYISWQASGIGGYDVELRVSDNKGAAASQKFTILVVPGDFVNPVITIISPTNVLETNQSAQILTGTINKTASLVINGQAVAVAADKSFSYPVTLIEGINTYSFVATDTFNNTGTQTLTLTLDTTPPVITISKPTNNSVTSQVAQTLTGTLSESASLTINDQTVTVAADNSFTYSATLTEGVNTFNIVATDTVTNATNETFTVTLDTKAPVITVASPADNSITNKTTQAISGSLNETATLTINGQSVTVGADNSFSHSVSLNFGSNLISFVATDEANNATTKTLTVISDSVLPIISVISPINNSITNKTTQNIVGALNESAILTINGQSVPLAADYSFSYPITFAAGNNIINLAAIDLAGNNVTQTISVLLDNIPPSISVASPANNSVTNQTSQMIVGAVSEPALLIINGQAVTVSADNTFSFNTVLVEGANTIEIVATDTVGNVAASTINLTLNTSVPVSKQAGVITGSVYDVTTKLPVAGVNVYFRNNPDTTITDANGDFQIMSTGTGKRIMFFSKPGYVDARRDTYNRADGTNSVGNVSLQLEDVKTAIIQASVGGSFTDSTGNVEVIIPPGALPNDVTLQATYLPTRESMPVDMPENMIFLGAVQMGPEHIEFQSPVTLRLKNDTLNLPPGEQVPFSFVAHDLEEPNEQFYDPGTATVSADGQFIEFQVTHFSCATLGFTGPATTLLDFSGSIGDDGTPKDDKDECKKKVASSVSNCQGSLSLERELLPVQAFGENDAPKLVYNSRTANPKPYISANFRVGYSSGNIPKSSRARLYIEGQQIDAFLASTTDTVPYHYQWDTLNALGVKVGTGSYPYRLETTQIYDSYNNLILGENYASSYTANIKGRVIVNDQSTSPIGAGWNLEELERIYRNADGSLLLTHGSGRSTILNSNELSLSAPEILGFGFGDSRSISLAADGGYYVSSYSSGKIFHIDLNNVATEVASNIPLVKGIALGNNNILYAVTQSGAVYQIPLSGTPSLLAQLSPVDHFDDMAVGPDGNIYVLDGGFGNIHRVTPSGQISYFYNGLTGVNPRLLTNAMSMVFDNEGNLYVSSNYNLFTQNQPNCGVSFISKFDALGNHSYYKTGLTTPRGITMDSQNNLYFVDTVCGNSSNYFIGVIKADGSDAVVKENLFGSTGSFGLSHDLVINNNQLALVTPSGQVFGFDIDYVNGDSFNFTTFSNKDSSNYSVLLQDAQSNLTRVDPQGTKYTYNADGLHTRTELSNGRYWQYAYDNQQRLIARTNAANQRWTFQYTGNGLSSITDPAGRAILYTVDNAGDLVQIDEPEGVSIQYIYDASHRVTSKTNGRGNTSQYTFGSMNNVTDVTQANGGQYQFDHAKARIAAIVASPSTLDNPVTINVQTTQENIITDARGITKKNVTNKYGNIEKNTDGVNRVSLYQHNRKDELEKTTRANSSIILRTYDEKGNVLTRTEQFNGATRTYTYDALSRITSITNPNNHTTTITRDTNGNPTQVINHLGHTTNLQYNSFGRVTRIDEPNGSITTFLYNALGLVTDKTEIPPVGNSRTSRYSYDASGLVTQAITPDNITLTITYDARGRRSQVSDNVGQSIRFTYDEQGNVIQTNINNSDGSLAQRISSIFDSRDRLITEQQPHIGTVDSITQSQLDYNDNLIGLTDPKGNNEARIYDNADRLIQHTHRLNGVTTYSYDTNNRIIRVVAPNGAITNYTYDLLGRRLTEYSADRGNSAYTYDLANNLLTKTDGRGITTTYTYDVLERPITKSLPNSIENVTYTYDNCAFGIGRLCYQTDESGSYTYSYDAFGNLVQVNHTELGVNYFTSYAYDDGNNLIGMTLPSGRQINYLRDGVRRIMATYAIVNSNQTTIVANNQYRVDGKIVQSTYGNGLSDTRNYDLQGRLLSQSLGGVDNRTYTYDKNSNLVTRNSTPQNSVYAYDALDRIVSDSINATTPIIYTYDLNGNRVKKEQSGFQTEDYFYNQSSNELTGRQTLQVGNTPLPNLPDNQFTYNDVNRMFQLYQAGQLKATYTYNAQGQRTRKTIELVGGGQSIIVYHYDLNGQLISETTESGVLIRDYVWQDSMPVAQIDNVNSSETLSFLHTDHLYTPRLATNTSGGVRWRWDGEAFGSTLANEIDGVIVNLRFPGQYYDAESGLHYNYFRYYDPSTGRYTRSDPIGLFGGLNTYGYVGGNPLYWIDQNGLNLRRIWTGRYGAYRFAKEPGEAFKDLSRYLFPPIPKPMMSESENESDVPFAPDDDKDGEGDKNCPTEKGKRAKQGDSASDQFEGIEKEQNRRRKQGDNTSIESIEKSKQRDKNALKPWNVDY